MLFPDKQKFESIDQKYKNCMEGTEKGTTGFDHFIRSSSICSVLLSGKLFGAKLIYVEVFDRIDKPTMSGKMVYPIADKFIVQWEEQKQVYKKAINLGSIF